MRNRTGSESGVSEWLWKDRLFETALCQGPFRSDSLEPTHEGDFERTVSVRQSSNCVHSRSDFERTASVRQPCIRDRLGQAGLCRLTEWLWRDSLGQAVLCPLTGWLWEDRLCETALCQGPFRSDSLVSTHEGDFERTVSVRQPYNCVHSRRWLWKDRLCETALCQGPFRLGNLVFTHGLTLKGPSLWNSFVSKDRLGQAVLCPLTDWLWKLRRDYNPFISPFSHRFVRELVTVGSNALTSVWLGPSFKTAHAD